MTYFSSFQENHSLIVFLKIRLIFYHRLLQITQIELPSGRKFKYIYDDYGGLHYAELPSGSRHTFSALTSLGFIRYLYLAPGASKPYIQHYSYTGVLLQEVNPSDGTRILYRYLATGQLSEVSRSQRMNPLNGN